MMSSADCADILVFFTEKEKSNLEALKNKWTKYRIQYESGWLFEPDKAMLKQFAYQKYLIAQGLRSDYYKKESK